MSACPPTERARATLGPPGLFTRTATAYWPSNLARTRRRVPAAPVQRGADLLGLRRTHRRHHRGPARPGEGLCGEAEAIRPPRPRAGWAESFRGAPLSWASCAAGRETSRRTRTAARPLMPCAHVEHPVCPRAPEAAPLRTGSVAARAALTRCWWAEGIHEA